MTFEEEFPSLTDKNRDMVELGAPDDPYYEDLFTESIIWMNCLDKARVKEAIRKNCNQYGVSHDNSIVMGLLKELGL